MDFYDLETKIKSSPTSTSIATAESSNSLKSPQLYSNLFSQISLSLGQSERLHPWSMPPHLSSGLHLLPHLEDADVPQLSSANEASWVINPLKRKKLQSIASIHETPILRNVLAQPIVEDSSMPVPFDGSPRNNGRGSPQRTHSNETDHSNEKPNSDDDSHSLCIDTSLEENNMENQNESQMVSYIPQPKPGLKRYKQYSSEEVLSAIECIRNGMSVSQAARDYGVPKRTIYEKLLGKSYTTTVRPIKRKSDGDSPSSSSHCNVSGDRCIESRGDYISPSMSAAGFLQHAIEARGGDIIEGKALHARALAAAALTALNGISTSPDMRSTNGEVRSSSSSGSSIVKKCMRVRSPESIASNVEHNQRHSTEVIVPPMTIDLIKCETLTNDNIFE